MTNKNNLEVDIATLEEQYKTVASDINFIKNKLDNISNLDKVLSELSIHLKHSQGQIISLSEDQVYLKRSLLLYEQELSRYKTEVVQSINTVDMKMENFINKLKGGSTVFIIFGGTVQTIILGVCIWVFSHVNEAEVVNKLQQQKIELIEKKLEVKYDK